MAGRSRKPAIDRQLPTFYIQELLNHRRGLLLKLLNLIGPFGPANRSTDSPYPHPYTIHFAWIRLAYLTQPFTRRCSHIWSGPERACERRVVFRTSSSNARYWLRDILGYVSPQTIFRSEVLHIHFLVNEIILHHCAISFTSLSVILGTKKSIDYV